MSCREPVPDLDAMADYLIDEIETLAKAAAVDMPARAADWPDQATAREAGAFGGR